MPSIDVTFTSPLSAANHPVVISSLISLSVMFSAACAVIEPHSPAASEVTEPPVLSATRFVLILLSTEKSCSKSIPASCVNVSVWPSAAISITEVSAFISPAVASIVKSPLAVKVLFAAMSTFWPAVSAIPSSATVLLLRRISSSAVTFACRYIVVSDAEMSTVPPAVSSCASTSSPATSVISPVVVTVPSNVISLFAVAAREPTSRAAAKMSPAARTTCPALIVLLASISTLLIAGSGVTKSVGTLIRTLLPSWVRNILSPAAITSVSTAFIVPLLRTWEPIR